MRVQCCVTRWRWYRVNAEWPKYTLDIVYSKSGRLNNGGPLFSSSCSSCSTKELCRYIFYDYFYVGLVETLDSFISFFLFKLYYWLINLVYPCDNVSSDNNFKKYFPRLSYFFIHFSFIFNVKFVKKYKIQRGVYFWLCNFSNIGNKSSNFSCDVSKYFKGDNFLSKI